jgi:hypothetical protein
VRDDAPVRRDDTPQIRQDLRDDRLAILNSPRDRGAAERRRALAGGVLLDELAHLVDRANAVQVTLFLRVAPGEEPVAAEDQPSHPGVPSTARLSISASSNPGRCHGTQMIVRPYLRLNSCIFRSPFALAARAIAQSGCR